jgi:hypothetical protein
MLIFDALYDFIEPRCCLAIAPAKNVNHGLNERSRLPKE